MFDGTMTVQDASGTTACTYPALTISNSGSLVVRFLARFRDAADTFTPTATWNEREDIGSTVRTGGQFHLQDKAPGVSGAQAAVTVAPSNTTAARYLAVTLAFKPPTPKQTGVYEMGLPDHGTPDTRTGHKIIVRAQRDFNGPGTTIRAQLFEGSTARSAVLETTPLIVGGTTHTLSIADADAASIGNYNNLSIKIWAYSANGLAAFTQVFQVYLETPAITVPSGELHSGTDSGAGSDVGALAAAVLLRTEAGTGSDVQGRTSLLTAVEAGVGSDLGLAIIPPTNIFGTDAGVGGDASDRLSLLVGAEAGMGSDVMTNMVTGIAATESGAGSEINSNRASVAGSDAGTGSEVGMPILSIAGFEVGAGSDVSAVPSRILLAQETGAVVDASALFTVLALTEAGLGSDIGAALVGVVLVSGSDAGTGSEAGIVTAALLAAIESGAGSEFGAIPARALFGLDSGAGLDTSQIAALHSRVESGSGLDVGVAMVAALLIAGSDAGVGSEVGKAAAALIAALDTGTSIEAGSIPARILLGQDAGSASEAAQMLAAITGTETGSLVELGNSFLAALLLTGTDAGVGSEVGKAAAALISALETGVGSEVGSIPARGVFGTDAGTGLDVATMLALMSRGETGTLLEVGAAFIAPLLVMGSDAGIGTEAGKVPTALLAALDSGNMAEAATILSAISRTDQATGAESSQLFGLYTRAETGAFVEIGVVPAAEVAGLDLGLMSELAGMLASVAGEDFGFGDDIGLGGRFEIVILPTTPAGRIKHAHGVLSSGLRGEVSQQGGGRVLETTGGRVR
jgi:hypothetical protein